MPPRKEHLPKFTDSEQENEDSDTEKSASGGNVASSTSRHGHKRLFEEDGEVGCSSKRKRIPPDEKDIMIPLELGWKRQTKIRCFSRSGISGEVAYYAPCGKKLRNYRDVIRYLTKHQITDISRENFSFSTKMNIGEFLEISSSGSGEDYVLLSKEEVTARIDEVRANKGRLGVEVQKQLQQEQKQLQHQREQQGHSKVGDAESIFLTENSSSSSSGSSKAASPNFYIRLGVNKRLHTLRKNIKRNNGQMDALQQDLHGAKNKLNFQQQEINNLKSQFGEYKKKMESMSHKICALGQELKQCKTELQIYQSKPPAAQSSPAETDI